MRHTSNVFSYLIKLFFTLTLSFYLIGLINALLFDMSTVIDPAPPANTSSGGGLSHTEDSAIMPSLMFGGGAAGRDRERRMSTVSGASTIDLNDDGDQDEDVLDNDDEHGVEGATVETPREPLSESPSRKQSVATVRAAPTGMLSSSSPSDVATLLRTMDFSARKHEHQRRKNTDSTPYINHPLGVACILSQYGVTHLPTLQAAILHDTVEDTDTTLAEIREEFGAEVARIVDECTDPPYTASAERKALQIKTAPHKSKEAHQVKLGDKLHNLRSIREDPPVGWTPKRCQDYFVWAKKVTDLCLPSLPAIAEPLNKLYERSHFVLGTKVYKCHPLVGGKQDVVHPDETDWIKQQQRKQKARSKEGTASPIFY